MKSEKYEKCSKYNQIPFKSIFNISLQKRRRTKDSGAKIRDLIIPLIKPAVVW